VRPSSKELGAFFGTKEGEEKNEIEKKKEREKKDDGKVTKKGEPIAFRNKIKNVTLQL
jgi:hypothetical protein